MRVIALVLLCVGIASSAFSGTKNLQVPSQYKTIQEAIKAAKPGDTVLIAPGKYDEAFTIDKPITVKGASKEEVILSVPVKKGVVITITSPYEASVENLTVEHADPENDKKARKAPDLLIVTNGGQAQVSNCSFHHSAGCGLVVYSRSRVSVKNCTADHSVQAGFLSRDPGAQASFVNCIAEENDWAGFQIIKQGSGEVIGCTARKNTQAGIFIAERGVGDCSIKNCICLENKNDGIHGYMAGEMVLEKNQCAGNGASGILIASGTAASLLNNQCENNKTGISIIGVAATAQVQHSVCTDNKQEGILVTQGARADLSDNYAANNGAAGLYIAHWETNAILKKNIAENNKANGIWVALGAEAELTENACKGNQEYGILASDEGTGVKQEKNISDKNGKADTDPHPDVALSRQSQVSNYSVSAALAFQQYDYLEGIAKRLRAGTSRFSNGVFQLSFFYDSVTGGCSELRLPGGPALFGLLQNWCAQRPDSITARVALARAYVNHAWDARGGGYASTVTQKGQEEFLKYLKLAEEVLQEGESLKEKDPELYNTWMMVGTGLSYKEEQERALFKKGVEIDPGYYPLYPRMANYLCPKWYGSYDKLHDFLDEAYTLSQKSMGNTGYSLLAHNYMKEFPCEDIAKGNVADWDRVEKGYRELVEQFPDSKEYLNDFCYTACWFQNRTVARELFEKIGKNPAENSWPKSGADSFKEFNAWAMSDTAPHPCAIEENNAEEYTQDRDDVSDKEFKENMRKRNLIFFYIGAGALSLSMLATLIIIIFFAVKGSGGKRR